MSKANDAKPAVTPIFGPAENAMTESATQEIVDRLQQTAAQQGVAAALAEAIGIMWGVGHVFMNLGLNAEFRQMTISLRKYVDAGVKKHGQDG